MTTFTNVHELGWLLALKTVELAKGRATNGEPQPVAVSVMLRSLVSQTPIATLAMEGVPWPLISFAKRKCIEVLSSVSLLEQRTGGILVYNSHRQVCYVLGVVGRSDLGSHLLANLAALIAGYKTDFQRNGHPNQEALADYQEVTA